MNHIGSKYNQKKNIINSFLYICRTSGACQAQQHDNNLFISLNTL